MINKNNPLNLRYNASNRWKGLTGNHKGFCEFESLDWCIRAVGHVIMWSYRKRGVCTYRQIINTYCPFGDGSNDPDLYLRYVVKTLQCDPDTEPKNFYDYARLMVRMAYIESCFVLDLKYIIYLFHKFNLKIYGKS